MFAMQCARGAVCLVLGLSVLFKAWASGDDVCLSNGVFAVELDSSNGGLSSLRLHDDPDRMNWIEGLETWGVPVGMEFAGVERQGDTWISRYRKGVLKLAVERTPGRTFLRERFVFRNTADYDLYFLRGQLGVFATFNDSYADAATCETKRCHAHIWCGGANSYVHALKMGPFPTELALILTQGDLDAYSVRRVAKEISNDRGDFVLHPAPLHFLPGETKVLEWELAAFPSGAFKAELLTRRGTAWIQFEQETIFPDETFRIVAECAYEPKSVKAFCNGAEIPFRLDGRRIVVEHRPQAVGEHRFTFEADGRRFRANGYVSDDPDTVIDRRVRFIIRKQQMTDPRSPLCGAYLIYDNEDKSPYFDYSAGNHNACRERLGMGLLVCRYLRERPDDAEVARSLDLFEAFVLREIFDEETGEVCNNIGKNAKYKRLYNAPWLITFWLEMYRLRGDGRYLVWIERAIRNYYVKGGAKFYPNGSVFSDAVQAIRDAGQTAVADELAGRVREHVGTIRQNGVLYPPHEVRFEQTIVTPALSILSAYYALVDADPAVRNEASRHVELLVRFDGEQPDHKWNSLPIRHWDGYWFGKRALYGDTQHYWSCLTAYALLLHGRNVGDVALRARARKMLRNLLCQFFPDGSASCAYLHPYTVTMLRPDGTPLEPPRRGEFFDPWANDQDFALYYLLRIRGEFGLSLKEKEK